MSANQGESRKVVADYSSLGSIQNATTLWQRAQAITVTQPPKPSWTYGSGATDEGESLQKRHIEMNPFEPGRPMFHNYSLLVSAIVPRPIGFISTLSTDGKPNLAPFSYFQVVDHDPPVFVVGFSGRANRPKDTLRNLEETGESCINIVSEHMIEAVNATSLDAPYETSEWQISGLHQAACTTVRPPRVQESVFSIEGKLCEVVEYKTSTTSAGHHGKLAIIEAPRFWAREDAIDADHEKLDLEVLRPVGQLGGISYARITDTFELARSNWATAMEPPAGSCLQRLTSDLDGKLDKSCGPLSGCPWTSSGDFNGWKVR